MFMYKSASRGGARPPTEQQRTQQRLMVTQAANSFIGKEPRGTAGQRPQVLRTENSIDGSSKYGRKQLNKSHIVKSTQASRSTAGLVVGKGSHFLSLKSQQTIIEKELTKGRSGNDVTIDESQAAQEILNQRVQRGVTTHTTQASHA